MASYAEAVQEYHEAQHEAGVGRARALAEHPEWESLPRDVREARVVVACEDLLVRARDASIAVDLVRAEREERWIAAHEDMYGVKSLRAS
jgi:hypothetical protein